MPILRHDELGHQWNHMGLPRTNDDQCDDTMKLVGFPLLRIAIPPSSAFILFLRPVRLEKVESGSSADSLRENTKREHCAAYDFDQYLRGRCRLR